MLTGLPERILGIHVSIIPPGHTQQEDASFILRHPPLLLNNSLFYATNYNQELFKTTVDNFFDLLFVFILLLS